MKIVYNFIGIMLILFAIPFAAFGAFFWAANRAFNAGGDVMEEVMAGIRKGLH